MQRFSDDDSGYLDWLAAHADGFVLNAYRNPTPTYLILHRATCSTISGRHSGGSRWTIDYTKICGSRAELEAFARDKEAFAVRMLDALREGGPFVCNHDGVRLTSVRP